MRNYCRVSNRNDDHFVGIRLVDGVPEVVFPHGYNIPDNEKELRKDVFRLISVLQRFSDHREGNAIDGPSEIISTLPIISYQFVINDYLNYGYYYETETQYIPGLQGKISWKRTIQKEKPVITGKRLVYLQFQTSKTKKNNDNLISLIHRYCVDLSMSLFGWLYFDTDIRPQEPTVKIDKNFSVSVLKKAILETYNDRKRKLFLSMINILENTQEDISFRDYSIGVSKFESVWEKLIDHVFGETEKEKYFPHAEWHIFKDGQFLTSSPLIPDTIMKYKDRIYILDAKYYRYGITDDPNDLPKTDSIQKQVTYGKHVALLNEVDESHIYNAFVMPYNGGNCDYLLKFVAVGTVGWEKIRPNYSYILGLLLDTRHLITTYSRHNEAEIEQLAEQIEESLEKYKTVYSIK